jgi:hypothetical protein
LANKVFINYRRDETAGIAGRLHDRLAKEFGKQNVFMDVDSIEPGLDFVKQLDDQVASCAILLAVIGPHWIEAADAAGERRLHQPDDYLRIEIASALKRNIPVVPVLLDGARMPHVDELPDDLKSLTRRQAIELRHSRFAADADAIVQSVSKAMPKRGFSHGKVAAGLAVVALAGAGATYWLAVHDRLATVRPAQQKPIEQSSPPSVAPQAPQPPAGAQPQSGPGIQTQPFAKSVTVSPGAKSVISRHWNYDKGTCAAHRIQIKIITPPSNGIVSWYDEPIVVPARGRGGAQSCEGKTIDGAIVYYQPNSGFSGRDTLRYLRTDLDDPNDRVNGEISVSITVQ